MHYLATLKKAPVNEEMGKQAILRCYLRWREGSSLAEGGLAPSSVMMDWALPPLGTMEPHLSLMASNCVH